MSESNKSLALMNSISQDLLGKIIEAGDITPEIQSVLAHIELNDSAHIDAVAHMLNWVKDQQDFWKREADQFLKVAKALAKVEEGIKECVKITMNERGVYDLHGSNMRFKLSEIAPRLEYDESKIPDTFRVQVVSTKIDAGKIEEALKRGEHVESAMLVPNYRLNKYVNKTEAKKLKAGES